MLPVTDKEAASLAGLNIPLVRQKIISMLHSDHTGAGLCGEKSFGGEPGAVRADASCYVVAKLVIKLKVGGLFDFRI
jgi:hypothetical protein